VELEARFKEELSRYGLKFNKLYAVTNMPINRFRAQLQQSGTYDEYMNTLVKNFDPEAARGVACRSLVSVGYDGRIYDCDFNQMLGMQITNSRPLTVFNFDFDALIGRKISFASHCFGCAAGGGGS
jgi:radical SAM/Cys-rich protein